MLSGHVQPLTILTSSSHAILTNPLQVPSTATYGAAGAWARSKIIESFAGFFWPRCSSGAVDRLLRRERCAVPPLSPPAPSSLSPSLACAQLSCSDSCAALHLSTPSTLKSAQVSRPKMCLERRACRRAQRGSAAGARRLEALRALWVRRAHVQQRCTDRPPLAALSFISDPPFAAPAPHPSPSEQQPA